MVPLSGSKELWILYQLFLSVSFSNSWTLLLKDTVSTNQLRGKKRCCGNLLFRSFCSAEDLLREFFSFLMFIIGHLNKLCMFEHRMNTVSKGEVSCYSLMINYSIWTDTNGVKCSGQGFKPKHPLRHCCQPKSDVSYNLLAVLLWNCHVRPLK